MCEIQRILRAKDERQTLCSALDRRQPNVARQLFEEWIAWATRSRLEPFKKAARTVRKYLDGIVEYVRPSLADRRSRRAQSGSRPAAGRPRSGSERSGEP